MTGDRLGERVRVGALGFLLVTPLVYAINLLCTRIWTPHKHPLETMVLDEANGAVPLGQLAYLAFLTAVVLAPAAEELIFRGVIQGWLERLFGRRVESEATDAYADPPSDGLGSPTGGTGGLPTSVPGWATLVGKPPVPPERFSFESL